MMRKRGIEPEDSKKTSGRDVGVSFSVEMGEEGGYLVMSVRRIGCGGVGVVDERESDFG